MRASSRSGCFGGKARVFFSVLAALVLVGWAGGGGNNQGGGGRGSTFTDSRDGRKYRTVRIGNLTWMAQNLNHAISGSWCYGDDESNCAKYGRLYTWDAAMRACPAGWRLPTRDDWNDLIHATGGGDVAGTRLKSRTGWVDGGSGLIPGTDDFGFSALPGGVRGTDGSFLNVVGAGFWWSATERGSGDAYLRSMNSSYEGVIEDWDAKGLGLSVLCSQG